MSNINNKITSSEFEEESKGVAQQLIHTNEEVERKPFKKFKVKEVTKEEG